VLPFQAQVFFTRLDGSRCVRCITQARPVTSDVSTAEAEVNIG
jgi:hypothetical protein